MLSFSQAHLPLASLGEQEASQRPDSEGRGQQARAAGPLGPLPWVWQAPDSSPPPAYRSLSASEPPALLRACDRKGALLVSPLQKGPPDWTSCSSSDLLCPHLLRKGGAVSPVISSVPGGNPLPCPLCLQADI